VSSSSRAQGPTVDSTLRRRIDPRLAQIKRDCIANLHHTVKLRDKDGNPTRASNIAAARLLTMIAHEERRLDRLDELELRYARRARTAGTAPLQPDTAETQHFDAPPQPGHAPEAEHAHPAASAHSDCAGGDADPPPAEPAEAPATRLRLVPAADSDPAGSLPGMPAFGDSLQRAALAMHPPRVRQLNPARGRGEVFIITGVRAAATARGPPAALLPVRSGARISTASSVFFARTACGV